MRLNNIFCFIFANLIKGEIGLALCFTLADIASAGCNYTIVFYQRKMKLPKILKSNASLMNIFQCFAFDEVLMTHNLEMDKLVCKMCAVNVK